MENQNHYEDYLLAEAVAVDYQYASTGQRFLNFFIDNILLRFGLSYATGAALGYVISLADPEFAYRIFVEQESKWAVYLASYLIAILNYLVYYTICEKLFKGYTLGKLITGTRAIREDGDELTFKDALLRSLARSVPFDAFSAFGGHPWHDTWTRTMVVQTR
jgi:uncharacterized RDD family membrane protein YckC